MKKTTNKQNNVKTFLRHIRIDMKRKNSDIMVTNEMKDDVCCRDAGSRTAERNFLHSCFDSPL